MNELTNEETNARKNRRTYKRETYRIKENLLINDNWVHKMLLTKLITIIFHTI